MRAVRRTTAFATFALLICLALASGASATSVGAGATFQGGNCLDTAQSNCGGWSTTAPTVMNRPYIKSLIVTPAGGSATTVISNTGGIPVASPDVTSTSHSIYAVVAPTNACNTTQTPGVSPGCYASPNRVTVSLVREVSAGNWSYDFTSATGSPAITTGATIDMTIGFRSAYSSLRWSWANGAPSYWQTTVTPGLGGDVRIKFSPRTMPDSTGMPNSCTTIPVSSCGDASTRPNDEVLTPQIILSMDTTLDAAFTGVLFASSSAFIGSLESSPITAGQAPTLTYGVDAPHLNSNGSDRSGTFYALVPNSILTLFGTSASGFNSDLLPITRTGDAGSFTPSWSEWTAGTNGTAGQLLTISNISFSSPKFVVGRQSSNNGGSGGGGGGGSSSTGSGSGGGGSTSLKVGQKATFAQLLAVANVRAPAGAKTTAKVSTPKICKVVGNGIKGLAAGTCRGTMTIKPKKGKTQKKAFTFAVTGGKRLPLALHH
jgi:hypothetical protein